MVNRTSRRPELLVSLDRSGGWPLHGQIEQALREAIREGRLQTGAAVPSTRTLATDLGVSRGVVVEAYEQLIAEGYLAARAGSPTRVAGAARSPSVAGVEPEARRFAFDFRPGDPDVRYFPREAWRRSTRRAVESLSPRHLGYGAPHGAPELRSALAAYLARARGVVTSPDQVLACTGCAQGLSIAARVLRKSGIRRLAVEDPCHPEIRRIVLEAGVTPVPVAVDGDGLVVDRLERTHARAVIVSPAHQNPMGSVLAARRRQQLLEWSSRSSRVVIEDDYDAEYRYDRPAVGALQGLAPERILYVGSASKILAPGLRLGWLVLPRPLLHDGVEVKRRLDNGSPVMEQLTYADFIVSGELDRHVRRMRQLYRRRREALLHALTRHCPGWKVRGAAAGLHLVAEPPRHVDILRLAERAADQSVRLYPLSDYCAARGEHDRGLVFGYAGLTEEEIAEGIRRMSADDGRRGVQD